MATTRGTWIVTAHQPTADATAGTLSQDEQLAPVRVCADLGMLGEGLMRSPAVVAMIDIDARPDAMLHGMRRLIDRFPQTRFVVVASEAPRERMLAAMQAGARHYLLKQTLTAELVDTLRQLVPGNSHHNGQATGRSVALLAASGGAGGTTIAINLANELQLLEHSPSLLIDTDRRYGGAGSFLGIRGTFGLSDVLALGGRIDKQLIHSTALNYSPDLHVLLSPVSIDFAKPAATPVEHLPEAINACRRVYGWTVLDAPAASAAEAGAIASACSHTLLVFQLTVKDLQAARSMLQALDQNGVAAERIVPVVNRYHRRRSMVELAEAQRVLNVGALTTISNDYKAASRSLNFGQTLAEAAPRSYLRNDVRELAKKLREMEA